MAVNLYHQKKSSIASQELHCYNLKTVSLKSLYEFHTLNLFFPQFSLSLTFYMHGSLSTFDNIQHPGDIGRKRCSFEKSKFKHRHQIINQ